MNVVSYLRVSSKGQVEGDGFDRQERAIEDFCRIQGLKNHREFQERGVSGAVEGLDRPAFSELIEFIEQCRECLIVGIVVERMDRLARDLMVSEVLLAECRKRNIQVFSADQGALVNMAENGGDPTRVLIRQIMGALAQWEKTMVVHKLRAARERIKASGGRCEGTKPYGHCAAEAPLLSYIIEQHNKGANFSNIARLLNAMDARTRSGRPFKPQNVRMIITNHNKNNNSKNKQ